MDLDVLNREVADIKAFRKQVEPMLMEMLPAYTEHMRQQAAAEAAAQETEREREAYDRKASEEAQAEAAAKAAQEAAAAAAKNESSPPLD